MYVCMYVFMYVCVYVFMYVSMYVCTGVRQGLITGYTGKKIKNIIAVGIGGSYLGPAYIHEVFKV